MWFFVTIFNVVILLNFLISFISSTYDEVYERGEIDNYTNMSQMNHEWFQIKKKFIYYYSRYGKGLVTFTAKLIFKLVLVVLWIAYYICCVLPLDVLTLGWGFGRFI